MPVQQEKLWDYAAVTPGQAGNATVVKITPENISRYALVAQNRDPRYHEEGPSPESGGAALAMPTMALSYAPLLREDIAEANGFVALEDSVTARRQTPFAKCEIRWFGPVRTGDTITGTRRVLEKYERRGSKFVTFRVEASNQLGERVAEYDYTCIFEYAQAQKQAPKSGAPDLPGQEGPGIPAKAARLLTFDNVSVGDSLAGLTVTESRETINSKNDFRLAGKHSASNIHTDDEFARRNIFGGVVNAGPATMSYVDQMLQLSFSPEAFYDDGRLLMRAIEPFRASDTVTFQGEITGLRANGNKKLVDCRIKGVNQRGDLVSLSDAALVLSK